MVRSVMNQQMPDIPMPNRAEPTADAELHRRIAMLMRAAEAILRSEGPHTEYALLRKLQAAPWSCLPTIDYAAPEKLFPVHFLLFHALYRLRDELGSLGEKLEVFTLGICIVPLATEGAATDQLCEDDPLRAFYLDLGNYHLPDAKIREMMDNFWRGEARRPCHDDIDAAARVLGFNQLPADFATVKQRYRREAMRTHPDRGGSHDQVQSLNLAFATLRQHFHRRGG
ncbi:MAG: molecular chaperone DnaJ [Marinobacter sp.]|nr:molecular chaperone DnaJ [Marinobacter sp.]